jgi:hypothetical protein
MRVMQERDDARAALATFGRMVSDAKKERDAANAELATVRDAEAALRVQFSRVVEERDAAKVWLAKCREMFQVTRRRMCAAMGIEDGKSWSWIEGELRDGRHR